MNAAAEALTTKIGPLPAWAWGLGAGATIAAGRALLNRREPEPEPEPEPIPTDIELGGEAFTLGTGPTATPVYRPAGSTFSADPVPTASAGPATNSDWVTAAMRWGLANTAFEPTTMSDALGRYLQGGELSDIELSFIQQAIRAIGPVPEGAPSVLRKQAPVSDAPTPTPQNPTPQNPTPVQPPQVVRSNGGPDGMGSFFAVLQTGDTIEHIPDGNQYAALKAQHGERIISEQAMASLISTSKKKPGAPRWTPGNVAW